MSKATTARELMLLCVSTAWEPVVGAADLDGLRPRALAAYHSLAQAEESSALDDLPLRGERP